VSKRSQGSESGEKPEPESAEPPAPVAWCLELVSPYASLWKSLDEANRADLELRAGAIEARGALRAQARRQAAEDWAQALHDRITNWLCACGARRPG